ncbi:MAG: histidine kinase [Rhodocyclaceae bacterium]|jgi:hypothetical protein|nr:histidine kinase [Rhodocyclaceae bacterium]MCA3018136.1 histidine kinase [Rhodocyclaceae bacterium]MCA3023070.1 histidine kinase [Rhodocyclaceae bacterium]MCA3026427.1 histidine kinase [Rhodocyclaceae bacterium]MCA3029262.1 histidine kinase [Rhodocyclaceae bacterium]
MNSLPWRFWINFVFAVGLGPALGVGAGMGASTGSVWIGVFCGLLFGVLFMAGAALLYRRAMRRRNPGFTFSDANVRQEATIELPVDAADAFHLCTDALNALPGFFATKSDPATGYIEGITGGGGAAYLGFGAPGEKLRVKIDAAGEASSRASIVSQPEPLFAALDFGKNRKNISSVSAHIYAALRLRLDEAKELAERAEMQRALTVAKLNALQSQIEPHFLYNTLSNAQSLTRTDPKRAEVMLGHLIVFLRASLLQDAEAQSTLGHEVDRVVSYLEIMKIRMGSRLQYRIDIEKSVRSHTFAPLMLQTLVENAIKHGLEPKPSGGMVEVTAEVTHKQLLVRVVDNGQGFVADSGGTGIGLRNVQERLRIGYGERATFALQSSPSGGVTAIISIPLVT